MNEFDVTPPDSRFEAADVVEVYNLLSAEGITVWVDGGWCVDALLKRQTRSHPDLDIAVSRQDNPRLRACLGRRGFQEKARHDSAEWMYVMQSPDGHVLDVHVFEYDDDGNNIYGVEYPIGSLTGKGVVGGQEVSCISPEWMFKFKTSYEPKAKDLEDVQALGEEYGFTVPDTHTRVEY